MIDLPVCEFRSMLTDGQIYCRHTRVHSRANIVREAVCVGCHWRDKPCDNPRPVEYAPLPEPPSVFRRLWNLSQALAEFVAEPGMVSEQEYRGRLEICESNTCQRRVGNICNHADCGCYLPLKAKAKAWHCPLKLWPGDKTKEQP